MRIRPDAMALQTQPFSWFAAAALVAINAKEAFECY
jgi:hypothetical protein